MGDGKEQKKKKNGYNTRPPLNVALHAELGCKLKWWRSDAPPFPHPLQRTSLKACKLGTNLWQIRRLQTIAGSGVMHTIHTAENVSWPWHLGCVWCGVALITFGLMVRAHTHTHVRTQSSAHTQTSWQPWPASLFLSCFEQHFYPFWSRLPIHVAVKAFVIPAMLARTHKRKHAHTHGWESPSEVHSLWLNTSFLRLALTGTDWLWWWQ